MVMGNVPLSKELATEIIDGVTKLYENVYGVGNISTRRTSIALEVYAKLPVFNQDTRSMIMTDQCVVKHDLRKFAWLASTDETARHELLKSRLAEAVKLSTAELERRLSELTSIGTHKVDQASVYAKLTGFTVKCRFEARVDWSKASGRYNLTRPTFTMPLTTVVKVDDDDQRLAATYAAVDKVLAKFVKHVENINLF